MDGGRSGARRLPWHPQPGALGTDAPYLEVHGEADQYGKPRLQPRCANGDGQLRNGMRRRLALAFSAEAQPGSAPDGIRV